MSHLSLALLGPLDITVDGQPVTGFATDKVRALLVYLVMECDHSHRRDTLAELLWPEQGAQVARNSLRQALATLRQAIGDRTAEPPFLHITAETIRFNPSSDHRLDVAVFTALLSGCEQHLHHRPETCTPCARRRKQAVALYRGDFLEQFAVRDSLAFEEWALLKREGVQRRAFRTLAALATYYERHGAYEEAEHYAWRQVELAPWREEAHRQLMRVLAASGQHGAALRQYAACRRSLQAELGVEPAAETTALYEQIRAEKPATPVARRAPTASLPLQSTSFVGRVTEIAELAERLTTLSCRLVTLVGPPGVGKTRLSQEVAADVQGDFDDGVAFVALAPISDPALVVSTIAQTLGVQEQAGEPLVERAAAALRDKRLLLVLDNFEQVIQAAGDVAVLLHAAPHLTVLATSRAPLHVSGEHAFPVLPLALPDPKQPHPADTQLAALAHYAAVALFVQRSQAVQPHFQFTDETAPTIVEICTRLDGLPLAIELAAARSRIFSPQALLTRLCGSPLEMGTRRLRLLTGGARDIAAHQQTLRDTIAWSYNLLGAPEQLLFRRLAVFAGGWTLEAAEAICTCGDLRLDVLDGLQALIEQNLVRQTPANAGEPRFDMLETIHEYAWDRLELSSEREMLEQQHAAYYLALAEAAEPHIEGGAEGGIWLRRLEAEHNNIQQVLERGTAVRGEEQALRMVGALWWFWKRRGYVSEGRSWLERALAAYTTGDPHGVVSAAGRSSAIQSKALVRAGHLAMIQNDYETARSYLEAGLSIYRERGDRGCLVHPLTWLAGVVHAQGDPAAAHALYQESLTIARELRDLAGIDEALTGLGRIAELQGDYARATSHFEELLTLLREAGARNIFWTLVDVGRLARKQGNAARAKVLFEESLALVRDRRDLYGPVDPAELLELGWQAYNTGDYREATRLVEESLALAREVGYRSRIARALHALGMLARAQGNNERTTVLLEESLLLFREQGEKGGVATVINVLGQVATDQGKYTRATALFQESLRQARDVGNTASIAISLAGLGKVALAQGNDGQAALFFQESLALWCDLGDIRGITVCMEGLAGVATGAGDLERAGRLFGAAEALRERMAEGMPLNERDEHARTMAAASAKLDEASWLAAWAEGQAMTLEQAIAYALEELPDA